ncbi:MULTISPECIES: hypothetical protein [unclassified Corynebacterium]|uniref:hypothetical protein n=1 Tax=unclassified Corynebacterium TaxID=2624378 RepID=UPI0008A1D44B|nr:MULTISPECIES: hypothetical protein [unclassified Corynebacterium]OFN77899.1 hypothetical protein HMPREF2537_06615 [Corynebacterium sp. HMSC074E01]OFP62505.1 hypothetical protein HMPREF2978_01110 [Corynebacterium sp. HMSC074C01]OHO62573.1 hypothetical protein HMPREF2743_11280 [Corynebacterium sp. HMSC036D02]
MSPQRSTRQRIYRRRRAAALVLLAALALMVVLAFGLLGTQPRTAMQGDQLGPDGTETAAEYRERAEASLAQADKPAYALVGFREPLSPQDVSDALQPAERMDAIVIGLAAPIAVPEPVAGATRADVIDTVLSRVADHARDIGEEAPAEVDAVVVYSGGSQLRALATDPRVDTVEVAPEDAAWGSFGVRPSANVGQNENR